MNRAEYKIMFDVEGSHWWYVSLHELIMKYVGREKENKGALTILDAGCGTGRLCELMAKLGGVSGCDASEIAIGFCSERGLRNVYLADLNEAGLGETKFDVITSIDVLYHQRIIDDSKVIGKFFNALRPGGLLILNLPAFEFLRSPHDIAVQTARRYTKTSLVSMLEKIGFMVEISSYRLGYLFLPIVIYRLVRRLKTDAGEATSDTWMPNAFVNALLLRLTKMENALVERSLVPFGTSVFVTARRPE